MLNVVGQVYKHPKCECYASNSILNFIFSIRLNVQRHHWIDYLIFLKKKRRINQETKSSIEHCVFFSYRFMNMQYFKANSHELIVVKMFHFLGCVAQLVLHRQRCFSERRNVETDKLKKNFYLLSPHLN